MTRRALLVTLIFLMGSGTSHGAAGSTGGTFLSIPVGAEPAALGSAYSALATDAYAPVWNPAGLGFLDSTQIAGQYLSYLQSINYEFISVVHPLRYGDSLGFSAQYLGASNIAGTDDSGNSTGSYSDTFGAYSLAYGHSFNNKFSLGLNGELIHVALADVSANAYAATLGTLYKATDKINLAAVVANIGSPLTFINDGDSLPLTFRLGGSYRPTEHWMLTSEASVPTSGPTGWHMGAEWRPLDLIAIRAGYRTGTTSQQGALAGFSTGIGINVWDQELSYAWVPYGDLGDTQYLSVLIRFGIEEEKRHRLIQYQNMQTSRTAKNRTGQDEENSWIVPDESLTRLLNDD